MIVRAFVYFATWAVFAISYERASSPGSKSAISASGLIAYVLTMTFASIDWTMSFTPHWRSTIFGLIAVTQQALVAFALVIVASFGKGKDDLPSQASRDIGNLLLTCVIFWAYLTFMQFLIVWSGNIPVETEWYVPRIRPPWIWIISVIAVFQFALPFASLLFRRVKQHRRSLIAVAICVVVIRGVDHLWWSVASYSSEPLPIVLAFFSWAVFGTLWISLARWQVARNG